MCKLQARISRRVRCAVYTRKSTSEGLDQEFNSLDAQRESAEAYIASQAQEGWICLPTRYDDGGFTGANMERPALKRLLADIEAGRIDCVVTYKVDRLSRSLLDFAKMMETFERHQISFASVTQEFNTGQSMGRLVLNVLLSFAQFEREIISERTRDKMAATRRKGKWSGGRPLLGYDIDPVLRKLIVNPQEAARVRDIFGLFLKKRALWPVVKELHERGWRHKAWTTHAGIQRGGEPFTTVSVQRLLTNPIYIGQVGYKGELNPGEHSAIVTATVWRKVQVLLERRSCPGRKTIRSPSGALLQGLLHCLRCGSAMTPTHTTRQGKRYRYYVCRQTWKHGSGKSQTVVATEIERMIMDHITGRVAESTGRMGWSPERGLGQLIARVDYDGDGRCVTISFHKEDRVKAIALQ